MADAYASNVCLFLPFVSSGNGNGFIVDAGPQRKSVNIMDGYYHYEGPFITSDPSSPDGESLEFVDNQGGHLSIFSEQLSDFIIGTQDFCFECWFQASDTGMQNFIIYAQSGGYGISWYIVNPSGVLRWDYSGVSKITSTTNVNDGTRRHLAISRESGTLRVFVDGVIEASVTDTTNYNVTPTSIRIGSNSTQGYTTPKGRMKDMRVTVGHYRYNANFTPAAIPTNEYGYSISTTTSKLVPFSFKYVILEWSTLPKHFYVIKNFTAIHDYNNPNYGGAGTISGTVKIGANAVKRRVRLYESNNGVLIKEIWSGEDGSYLFKGLRTDFLYTVTALDYNTQYNDVIASNITAVV